MTQRQVIAVLFLFCLFTSSYTENSPKKYAIFRVQIIAKELYLMKMHLVAIHKHLPP